MKKIACNICCHGQIFRKPVPIKEELIYGVCLKTPGKGVPIKDPNHACMKWKERECETT